MAIYDKSDMVYDDYSKNAFKDDDPKVTGKPDSTFLNRGELYEVLYLINKYMKDHGLEKVSEGKKIEKMIHDKLPGSIRSQEKVVKWIEDNWDS